jgi:FMN reductase
MNGRTVVVITAGLSRPSATRLLADQLSAAAVTAAEQQDIALTAQVVELRDLAHEIADHLLTGFPPPALKQALDQVATADALIAVTPIFSASYSGLFKSFIDVIETDTLLDKPVLMAATAGTARHSLALEHAMRPLFAHLRAAVIPTAVFAAADDWGADSADGTLRSRITRAAGELAREISRRPPATAPDPFALTTNFEDLLKNL